MKLFYTSGPKWLSSVDSCSGHKQLRSAVTNKTTRAYALKVICIVIGLAGKTIRLPTPQPQLDHDLRTQGHNPAPGIRNSCTADWLLVYARLSQVIRAPTRASSKLMKTISIACLINLYKELTTAAWLDIKHGKCSL